MKWVIGVLAVLSVVSLFAVAVYDYNTGDLGLLTDRQAQSGDDTVASPCCQSAASCATTACCESEADCCQEEKAQTAVKPAVEENKDAAAAPK